MAVLEHGKTKANYYKPCQLTSIYSVCTIAKITSIQKNPYLVLADHQLIFNEILQYKLERKRSRGKTDKVNHPHLELYL